MKTIPDNTRLSQMSIPGTHNTMTAHDSGFFGACQERYSSLPLFENCLTQEWHLKEQLQHGIRFIDIRIEECGTKFCINHGPVYLDVTLEEVFTILFQFLKQHPTETVS